MSPATHHASLPPLLDLSAVDDDSAEFGRDCDVDLLGDTDFYWCEIPRSEAQALFNTIERIGFRQAREKFLLEHSELAIPAADFRRADFVYRFLEDYNARPQAALDLGSGWGEISRRLAGVFDQVWSVEAVKERAKYQYLQKQELGFDNLHIMRQLINRPLPFADESFDFVALNGVLEWVGCGDHEQPAAAVQQAVLREVRRVLKPGGCLYIGIENRYALNYLLGARDHCGLRFASFLPRRLADLYIRFAKRFSPNDRIRGWSDYRTPIYSFWGYHRVLKLAGFDSVDTHWPLPSYSKIRYAGPLCADSVSTWLRHVGAVKNPAHLSWKHQLFLRKLAPAAFRILPNAALNAAIKLLLPAFLIYAYKPGGDSPHEPQSKRSRRWFTVGGDTLTRLDYEAREVTQLLRPSCGEVLGRQQRRLMERHSGIHTRCDLMYHNVSALTSQMVDCRSLSADSAADVSAALRWLQNFAQTTQDGVWPRAAWSEHLSKLRDSLQSRYLWSTLSPEFQERIEMALTRLAAAPPPRTAMHGDYAVVNFKFDRISARTYVFDWTHGDEIAQPMFDWVTFWLSVCSERGVRPEQFFARVTESRDDGLFAPAAVDRDAHLRAFKINASRVPDWTAYTYMHLMLRAMDEGKFDQCLGRTRELEALLLNHQPRQTIPALHRRRNYVAVE